MMYFLNRIKLITKGLLIACILVSGLLVFLLTTTSGLVIISQLATLILPGKLQIQHPQGRLFDHFSFTQLSYSDKKLQFTLTNFHLKWQWKSLMHHRLILEQVKAQDLSITFKNTTSKKPSQALLPRSLVIQDLAIDRIKIISQRSTTQLTDLQLQAQLINATWLIDKLQFNLVDKPPAQKMHFMMQGQGQLTPPYTLATNLQFKSLNVKQNIQGMFKLAGDLSLYYWQGELTAPQSIVIHGTLRAAHELHSLATWHQFSWPLEQNRYVESRDGSLQIDGSLPQLHLRFLSMLSIPISTDAQLNGQTQIDADATLTDVTNGQIDLKIQPSIYQFINKNTASTLQFAGGQLQAQLTPKQLLINGNLLLDQYKSLFLILNLPKFRLNQEIIANQPIKGRLALQVSSLNFVEQVSNALSHVEGQLNAELLLRGTLGKLNTESHLALNQAKLFIPQLGLNLDAIQFTLQSHDNHWTAQGAVSTQKKVLTLNGQGDLTPEINGSFTLHGNDFPLIKTNDYAIDISPQLTFRFKPDSIDMTGEILIPAAQIKPQNFTNTTGLSEDAVFIGAAPPPSSNPNPLALNTHIRLVMGKYVAIDVKGLRGFLNGSLWLHQKPHEPLTANGELTIRNGKYQAYGQNLTIDQGQLIFTGGTIENPGINIRAIRHFNNANAAMAGATQFLDFNSTNLKKLDFNNEITVGIEVSGRLSSPKIKLFSEPPSLSQADTLSMLLLGKPANQAGGQLLLQAISSMQLGTGTTGTQLLSQLKQTLGIDLNIQNNAQYNPQTKEITESNSLVVGKSVTKRIYVSYNFGLAQTDANVFTLTYLLNKFFSVQVNASTTASGIDLLYTHQKVQHDQLSSPITSKTITK